MRPTLNELAQHVSALVTAGTDSRAEIQAALVRDHHADRIAAAHATHLAVRLGLVRYVAKRDAYKTATR